VDKIKCSPTEGNGTEEADIATNSQSDSRLQRMKEKK
jgi:hypothetical protein